MPSGRRKEVNLASLFDETFSKALEISTFLHPGLNNVKTDGIVDVLFSFIFSRFLE